MAPGSLVVKIRIRSNAASMVLWLAEKLACCAVAMATFGVSLISVKVIED